MSEKLRLGVLLDSRVLPLWQYTLLERLIGSGYASIALIVLRAPDAGAERAWRHAAFQLYMKLDEKLFAEQPDAFARRDAAALLGQIPSVEATPARDRHADELAGEDIERIRQHDLDVLLDLGVRTLRGEVLRAARYGVWSYEHGDEVTGRGGPAGFHEVMANRGVTGVRLLMRAGGEGTGRVLYESFSQTDNRSTHRNRSQLYWKALAFVPRTLRRLHAQGAAAFLESIDSRSSALRFETARRRDASGPGNAEMLALACAKLARFFADKLTAVLYREQWILMYRLAPGPATGLQQFARIIPPRDRYYADPFVVAQGGKHFLFVEEFRYATDKGHIAVIAMDEAGGCGEPVTIIEQPYHLSYPFVFRHGDDFFLIPESGANRRIDIYRCVEFPYRWTFEMTLMKDVHAVDATVLHHDERFWLFANVVENPGASSLDELHVFHADSLLTRDWTPHRLNPVVSDVRRARPAGAIFTHAGRIIRPSQNCAKLYGYGMKMNEITLLSEDAYAETEIASIEPTWDRRLVATHTFNHTDGITVIDGVLRTRRLL